MTCLDDEGMSEINKLMDYYLENAKILKEVRGACTHVCAGVFCAAREGGCPQLTFGILSATRLGVALK